MDFPELILILLVALIVLGPEKTIELAGKLGELLRKVRETWDELRYQMYLEEINRKVEESKNLEEEDKTELEEITKLTEEYNSLEENTKTEEVLEDGSRTSQDATDGTSERTKTKAD